MTTREKQEHARAAQQLASMCRAYFEALQAEGFDGERAMRIVVAIVGGSK